MEIALRSRPLRYRNPFRRRAAFRDRTCFEVVLREGSLTATGEAAPLEGWTESDAECRRVLESFADLHSTEQLWDRLDNLENRPAARHGLSQAALVLESLRRDQPLYRHLGGNSASPRIAVNALVIAEDLDSLRKRVRSHHEDGYRTMKVKPTGEPGELFDCLADLARQISGSLWFRVDANESWSLEEHREVLESGAGPWLEYLEQPFPRDRLEEHRQIGNHLPIALDESALNHSLQTLQQQAGARYVILKPMALGGLDRARNRVLQAQDQGLKPVITNSLEGTTGRLGALHLAASLADRDLPASGLATARFLNESAHPDEQVQDGTMQPGTQPGLGQSEADPPR